MLPLTPQSCEQFETGPADWSPTIDGVGPNVAVLVRLAGGDGDAVCESTLLATSFHPELTENTRFLDLIRHATKECSGEPE